MNVRPLLGALLVAVLAACNITTPPPGGDKTVASLSVSPPAVTLLPSATANLTVTAKNQAGDVLDQASVAWNSDNPSVATVAGGVVTGVAPGVAHVTATSG
ncbi:MAG TPA: Ig-like domain-containing protein, partial [Deinococcales bacterium]|nr:Ig-like domain-containing protein [Deinococcales bacterium]